MHRKYSGQRKYWMDKIKNVKPLRNRIIFPTPAENIFKEKCLLIMIILGYHFNRAFDYFLSKAEQKINMTKWNVLKNIHCNCKSCNDNGYHRRKATNMLGMFMFIIIVLISIENF